VSIDAAAVTCDHNLFINPGYPDCVALAGERLERWTLDTLRGAHPGWAGDTLSADPRFVDMANLDFRLRGDSPALQAGVASPEVPTDLLGKPRPSQGPCSLGCHEGAYAGPPVPRPEPEVVIAPREDAEAIGAIVANRYDFDWQGMLWGWGQMLPETLPLEVEVQGPRQADFLSLSGRFTLRDVLERIAREHQVRRRGAQAARLLCPTLRSGPAGTVPFHSGSQVPAARQLFRTPDVTPFPSGPKTPDTRSAGRQLAQCIEYYQCR
jgi:hypothetical protein